MAQQPQYYVNIFSDLLETQPTDPIIMPDPYNHNQSIGTNIKMFYRLLRWSIRVNDHISELVNAYYLGYLLEERLSTPSERRKYRSLLTKHYLNTCVRTYNLFRITGVQQIYRIQQTSFWMLQKIKRTDYVRLLQDAITLI